MTDVEWSIGLSHPCTIQIFGSTGCGKTRFVPQILENRLIEPFPGRILWEYGEWQDDYEAIQSIYPHIEFINGWREELYNTIRADETNLLVLDDQMCEASDSKQLTRLFTRGSHHRNLIVIDLPRSKRVRKGTQFSNRVAECALPYCVPQQTRCKSVPHFRLSDIASSQRMASRCLEDATRKQFGYLLIDNHPRTADEHRIRTCILPGEQACYYTERRQDLADQPPPNRRLNHMTMQKNKRHRSLVRRTFGTTI